MAATASFSSQRTAGWPLILLVVAISAGAYYLSTGLGRIWPLAWVAPIPILLLAFRSSWRTASLAAFAAYFLGSLNLLAYAATFHAEGMPGAVGDLLAVAFVTLVAGPSAIAFSAATIAARYAVGRTPGWLAAFLFPCAWTSYEFLCSLVAPNGTLLSMGYSQVDFLPLLQITSLAGLWGVAFLVTLVPSAIAVGWHRRDWSAMVPALTVTLAVLAYGAVRLRSAPEQPTVRVGLAATDHGIEDAAFTRAPAEALAVAKAYAGRIGRVASQGAQVVVLPEKFLGVTPADSAEVAKAFSDAAVAGHVTVIAGLNRIGISPPRNVAMVFSPDGRVIVEYEKHHMVPVAEREFLGLRRAVAARVGQDPAGYAIGKAPAFFSAAGEQWGVAICKDMDFPAWTRAYGRQGVRILAVPAWDFVVDARLHSRMAIVRGVENGFSIARTAEQGVLTFSDAYGRILAEAPSSTLPEALIVRDISPGPGATFYTRHGDWLGWLSTLGLVSLLAGAIISSRLTHT
jgi:apolipoprotein N-acyltransferase